MKKFAKLDRIGRWEYKGGKKIIYCTVEHIELVAEANTWEELPCPLNVEYRADGTWHSYTVEPRAHAKRTLGLI